MKVKIDSNKKKANKLELATEKFVTFSNVPNILIKNYNKNNDTALLDVSLNVFVNCLQHIVFKILLM